MAGIASGICYLAVGSGDGRRRQTTQAHSCPNNCSNSNTSSTSEESAYYSNAGKQNVKGLTNQTGYVKGNANGLINFGNFSASPGAHQ